MQARWVLCVGLVIVGLGLAAACNEKVDRAATPTIATLPTQDRTLIALEMTNTPSRTPRPSIAPSDTPTATLTHTLPPTYTLTSSPSPTDTSSPSATYTQTPRPTDTATAPPSPTRTPSLTNTPSPSATYTQTPRPTNTATASPSPTRTPSLTNTPSPSATFTQTLRPTSTALPTATQTLLPSDTPIPQIEVDRRESPIPAATAADGQGEEEAVGIGGTPLPFASVTPLPTLAPFIPATSTPLSLDGGGGAPQQPPPVGEVVITDSAGTIIGTNNPAQVTVLRQYHSSPNGSTALFGADNQLYVNGSRLEISPSSQFGMPAHMRVIDMQWTSDGRYLAFVVEGDQTQTDQAGVWVLDAAANASHQIMRNDDRHARQIAWSPDNTVLLIRMTTPAGGAMTFLPRDHQANEGFGMHFYPDATWAIDGKSVIVSGGAVLGRVHLDFDQTFEGYDLASAGIAHTHAAIELRDGRLVFLGGASPEGAFRLYLMSPNQAPAAVSGEITGRITAWEWHTNHRTLLVMAETSNPSDRRLWIVGLDGILRDVTPPEGAPMAAHWR